MQTNNLPQADLKKYGIINDDNSFSKKLSAEDIKKFLQGYTIVADNEKSRATFQLVENNTRLNVVMLERDKTISEILTKSHNIIQYTGIQNLSKSANALNYETKAFVFDQKSNQIVEFDLIKNATELTAIVASKKDNLQMNRYKTELLKLQGFLQDKIDQFPKIAKEITNDLNIVSKEINTVNVISQNADPDLGREKSDIQLNVNDPDLYQDANKRKEENLDEDQPENISRGFRR